MTRRIVQTETSGKPRIKPANPAPSAGYVRALRVLLRLRFLNPQLVSAGQAPCCGLCGLCGLLPAVAIEQTAIEETSKP